MHCVLHFPEMKCNLCETDKVSKTQYHSFTYVVYTIYGKCLYKYVCNISHAHNYCWMHLHDPHYCEGGSTIECKCVCVCVRACVRVCACVRAYIICIAM